MRILHWALPFFSSYGGRENFIANLARDQQELGHSVRIIGFHPELDSGPISEVEFGDLDAWCIGAKGFLSRQPGMLSFIYQVALAAVSEFKPDVIHCHNPQGHDILVLKPLLARLGIPMVMTIHAPPRDFGAMGVKVLAVAAAISTQLVAISEYSRQELTRDFPVLQDKIILINNGVPIAQHISEPESDLRVFAMGRLSSEKGFAQLLSAFALLRQVLPDARLEIAGQGQDSKILQEFARSIGLEDVVEFTGWLDPGQIAAALNRSAILVVPSAWQEPFGLVATEAMALARPVIASNRGALPEIVVHGETGYIFESGDLMLLASQMRDLLTNPKRAREFGVAGRARALEFYDQRRVTKQYLQLYSQLAGVPKGFQEAESKVIAANEKWSVFEQDLAITLQHRDNLTRVLQAIRTSPKPMLFKLTHDTSEPMPSEITDNSVVFRTSMLASVAYHNEYSKPMLIHGLEFEDWTPVSMEAAPRVGFVGQSKVNSYHNAIVNRVDSEVEAAGLVKIEENFSLLRTPVNIGLVLRERLLQKLRANSVIQTTFLTRELYHYKLPEGTEKTSRRSEFLQNLEQNPYSVCVRGTGNYSIRLFETLAAGRIPIILNSNMVFPLDGLIPWRELGPWVEISDIDRVDEILLQFHASLSPSEFEDRQRLNREIWLRYLTKTGFWTHALKDLELK